MRLFIELIQQVTSVSKISELCEAKCLCPRSGDRVSVFVMGAAVISEWCVSDAGQSLTLQAVLLKTSMTFSMG